jgi:xanthine/uracil permease
MIIFIKKNMMVLVGILIGAIAGYLYWKLAGCSSGTCPITSNPVRSSLNKALSGGLLSGILKN